MPKWTFLPKNPHPSGNSNYLQPKAKRWNFTAPPPKKVPKFKKNVVVFDEKTNTYMELDIYGDLIRNDDLGQDKSEIDKDGNVIATSGKAPDGGTPIGLATHSPEQIGAYSYQNVVMARQASVIRSESKDPGLSAPAYNPYTQPLWRPVDIVTNT